MRLGRPRQSRSVTFLYGGIAGALLMVIATVALIVAPPSPPSVAEFAPRAEDTVDEAPESQSSRFGGAGGSCPPGAAWCDPDDPAMAQAIGRLDRRVIEKARVRRCVGDPPRQTEDPQSPPCVNYWEGDNGGATAKGVTRDEIRLAHPNSDDATPNLAEYFNRRYEFYGRKLVTVGYDDEMGACDPASASSRGQAMATLGVFAAVGGGACRHASFPKEVARQEVVTVHRSETLFTQKDLAEGAPYLWSYFPAVDDTYRNFAEFACKGLVGREASHAGPELSLTTRAFAVFVSRDETHPVRIVTDGLTKCGAEPVVVEEISGAVVYTDNDPSVRIAVAKAQTNGATSIVCLCSFVDQMAAMVESERQAYRPEWVMPGLAGQELMRRSGSVAFGSAEQRGRSFGISGTNKPLREEDRPSQWAMKELGEYESWYNKSVDAASLDAAYHALLVLASGIQMAGPRLTPADFERGLQTTRFPNPGSGQAPYWQAGVGFGRGDYAMINDFTMMWLDNTRSDSEVDQSNESVSFCYIRRGARHSLGRWPTGAQPFFDRTQPCR